MKTPGQILYEEYWSNFPDWWRVGRKWSCETNFYRSRWEKEAKARQTKKVTAKYDEQTDDTCGVCTVTEA